MPWIDREVRVSEERRLQSIRMDPVRTRKPDLKGILSKDRSRSDEGDLDRVAPEGDFTGDLSIGGHKSMRFTLQP